MTNKLDHVSTGNPFFDQAKNQNHSIRLASFRKITRNAFTGACLGLAISPGVGLAQEPSTLPPVSPALTEPHPDGLHSDLPRTWCGEQPTSRDNTTYSLFPQPSPQIKVIYAVPADRQPRLAMIADSIQATTTGMARYMSFTTKEQKTFNFDRGTNCGPQYIDITQTRLKHNTSFYQSKNPAGELSGDAEKHGKNSLANEMARKLKLSKQLGRIYLIFVDGMVRVTQAGLDYPDGENAATPNRKLTFLYVPDRPKQRVGVDNAWIGQGTHEVIHAMGGVNTGALHATAGGHCFDGRDLLCYPDGSKKSERFTEDACKDEVDIDRVLSLPVIDCGGDDYFNVNGKPIVGRRGRRVPNLFNHRVLALCSDSRITPGCRSENTLPR